MNKRIEYSSKCFIYTFFFLLPYFLFRGKLFIGGDDTRLFYIYPAEFLQRISFYSWYHFSSVGFFNPNHFSIPLFSLWAILKLIIPSQVFLSYFAFSLPLIGGFTYFQKFIKELLILKDDEWYIPFAGSLFYVLSPILVLWQLSVFLYSVWLIVLVPILFFHFIRFYKTDKYIEVWYGMIWSVILSLSLFSIPWWLGVAIPFVFALIICTPLFSKSRVVTFTKRIGQFFAGIAAAQSFWLLPFVMTFLDKGNSGFGGSVMTKKAADTFSGPVMGAMSGNLIFPLFNLFHRQSLFDSNSSLKYVFLHYYDHVFLIHICLIFILFLGLFYSRKHLNTLLQRRFMVFFSAFLVSLYLFTVNIGPLKYIFLFFGKIPGFLIFRNYYDKFSVGYAFIYASLLTFLLYIVTRKYKQRIFFTGIVLLSVFINIFPVTAIINRPLGTTSSIGTTSVIPDEYYLFMQKVKQIVPYSSNVFALPYNIASYAIIKDETSNNVFAGTSPTVIFTGINDFTGELSMPEEASKINNYLVQRQYDQLLHKLLEYDISYVLVTNNIPTEVKKSYLFKQNILPKQDNGLIRAITDKEIIKSAKGNYILYSLKRKSQTFNGGNIEYVKINPVTYKVYVKSTDKPFTLTFLDTYHPGWKIYVAGSNSPTNSQSLFTIADIKSTVMDPLFESTHAQTHLNKNAWVIDPRVLKKSNDFVLTVYFKPQMYFYLGSLITVMVLLFMFILSQRQEKHFI